MPCISVVIPAYNSEKTIRETIDSVLNQTFSDFELIVINDGSQDSTLEILTQINDSRLKVFSYPNGGLPMSRNRGIRHARGEYISFIDADDLWTADKLELQLQTLKSYPEAAVAYSWTNNIDETGRFLRRGSHLTANGNVYVKLLLLNFIENGSNPLIPRSAFEQVGYFDETLKSTEDWDFWLRLAACYPFVAVSKPQILYRQSQSSMTSRNLSRLESTCLQVLKRGYERLDISLQQNVKSDSLANIYKYLAFKALSIQPEHQEVSTTLRLVWKMIQTDPAILQTKTFYKVLLKLIILVFFPAKLAQQTFQRFQMLADCSVLMGYLKLEVPSENVSLHREKICL